MDLLPDIWRQDYWLPPGVTWRDMEQLADADRPQPLDLLIALPLALGFVALRYVFERFFAPPMGRYLGVKNRSQKTTAPSPQLESFYTQQTRKPTHSEIAGLISLCGKTQRQIEVWFRLRRNQDRPCQSKKFGEAAWRFFFYLLAFMAGLTCLIDRPWFWHLRECWRGYPIQSAKMFNYGTGWKKTCDALFVVFAVVFLVTRLVIFPSKIIHTTLALSMEVFEPFVGYYFFNILLMVLQALHIFWAGLILRMVYKFLKGKLEKDERSDEESEIEEEEEDKGGEENADHGDYCWERSKDTLNSKLSMLTNTCVLNSFSNQRASVSDRMRKAQ
ncbi:ceramide synthase 2-like isoform X2 [Channa argus]|uniref:ceramide synthase 2-like isoform X2 n=1 Tax=Channa argus TaxID=215402 RepID=UPI003521070D